MKFEVNVRMEADTASCNALYAEFVEILTRGAEKDHVERFEHFIETMTHDELSTLAYDLFDKLLRTELVIANASQTIYDSSKFKPLSTLKKLRAGLDAWWEQQ